LDYSPSPFPSKFYIPQPRQALVLRPRLLQQLAAGLRGSLTLISAPPGFGKTTLLADWAKNEPRLIAWIALDSDDNDPQRFVSNLAYAFAPLLKAWKLPSSLPPQLALETLLGELSAITTQVILVMDDYHVIQSATVNELLTFLLDHLPAHLRLVIATRADPPFPLARLRARGELKELRADELRFTNEEAAAFLTDGMGLSITPEQVAVLEAKTEGWISGLQLAALSLQGSPDPTRFIQAFSGSHRYILDYLVEEVLTRLPAHIQEFLLRTSILEQLCAPLCDAVIGAENNAQATLEYLDRANIFTIPLDDERHWYRYHHLFADLLRIRLSQNHPELVAGLHQRAAHWLIQHEQPTAAVQHALMAKDFSLAADLLQANSSERWAASDMGFLNLLAQLPGEVLQARPTLGIHRAWTLVIQSRLDEANTLLASLQPHLRDDPAPEIGALRGFSNLLSAYIHALTNKQEQLEIPSPAVLELIPSTSLAMRNSADVMFARLLTYQGRFDEAAEILLSTVHRDIAAGGTTAIPICIATLMRLRLLQGRLREAEALGREYLQHIAQRDRRRYYTSGLLEIALSEVLLEKYDLAAAEELALQGILHNQPWHIPQSVVLGYLRLAQVQLAQGKLIALDETLQTIETMLPSQTLPPDILHELRLLRLKHDLARGHLFSSREWAATLPANFSSDYRLENDYLQLARLHLAEKNDDLAISLLEKLQTQAADGGRNGRLIEIWLLLALAHFARGHGSAFAALDRSLALAVPEGFVRVFVDAGQPARDLLSAYQRGGSSVYRNDAARLLAFFPQPGSAPSQTALLDPLTPRELDVLRCLAQGDSNQAIAEKLFITMSAVKKHTGNIYRKLEAESRTQAVARARESGLI
jgi:LuxR family maltose regulon positive regulatory protein